MYSFVCSLCAQLHIRVKASYPAVVGTVWGSFSLPVPVAIEVGDASVHPCDVALLDLCATVWRHTCVGCIWPGDDQSSFDTGFFR